MPKKFFSFLPKIDSHGHSPWSSLAHFVLRAVSSNASPTAESRGPRCFAIRFQNSLLISLVIVSIISGLGLPKKEGSILSQKIIAQKPPSTSLPPIPQVVEPTIAPMPTPTLLPANTATPTPSPIIKTQVVPTPTPQVPGNDGQNQSEEEFMLREINNYRSSRGLSSVSMDNHTCSFAAVRAKEISITFNHEGFSQRADNKQLPYPTYSSVTENIAKNRDFTKVVSGWINSAGHAANMQQNTPFVCVKSEGDYYAYEGWRP